MGLTKLIINVAFGVSVTIALMSVLPYVFKRLLEVFEDDKTMTKLIGIFEWIIACILAYKIVILLEKIK